MILEDYLEVKISKRNKKYYEKLGYTGELNEIIFVKNEDVSHGTNTLEKIKCDCCGKIEIKKHKDVLRTRERFNCDLCAECGKRIGIKRSQQSKIEKYGSINPFEVKEIREKIENTMLERYGVVNPFSSSTFQEKVKETLKNKYNVDNCMKCDEIKQKVKETVKEKYGVENPMQNKEVRRKLQETLSKNGKIPTSKQQLELFNLCEQWFPNYLVKLNYPCDSFSLDIKITINEKIQIDLEYDGQYWHQDQQRDRRRDEVIKTYGYKIIRIKSNKLLPTKEQLEEAINYVVQDNHTFSQIKLSDWKEEDNK